MSEPKSLKELCAEQNISYETALEVNCENWRQEVERLRAENAELRDQRDKTVSLLAMSCTAYHGTTCLDPDDDGRPADIGSACNVCSIRAMLTGAGE